MAEATHCQMKAGDLGACASEHTLSSRYNASRSRSCSRYRVVRASASLANESSRTRAHTRQCTLQKAGWSMSRKPQYILGDWFAMHRCSSSPGHALQSRFA